MTAREAAFKALKRVMLDGAYSNLILDRILSGSDLSARDKAFTSIIFYGVMEKQLLLDYNIQRLSDRPLGSIEKPVLVILRMGMYQLFFMESVPQSAAVNESVNLCKVNKLDNAKAFVNAVLRSAVKFKTLYLPDKRKGKNKNLSIKYSCPEALVRLWRNAYGDEITAQILESLEGRPPVTARVNTLRTDTDSLIRMLEEEGIKAVKTDIPDCIMLDGGSPSELASFGKGLFHIQDMACQICCGILGARSGETVTDACSAPGGKAFTLSEMMENKGRLISCDLYENRLKLVRDGAKRLGISIIETTAGSSSDRDDIPMSDRILCDVPCSGLGIIRRKPELRYKEDTGAESLPQIQYDILCNCSRFLRPGGRMVYSTCTLDPDENGKVVRRFLSEHKDFSPAAIELPYGIRRRIDEPENELTLFPEKNGTDGFFISLIVKR